MDFSDFASLQHLVHYFSQQSANQLLALDQIPSVEQRMRQPETR
jgi:hypothetical protein